MSVRIAMALSIAMIAAGCFGGDGTSEESTEATSVEPEPVGESASDEEEREGAAAGVVSDDSLRVCCRFEGEEIPPYYECPSVGCRPRGFDPELVELVDEELAIAVSPDAEHWKAKLNAALGELEEDGRLPELREEWFGDER